MEKPRDEAGLKINPQGAIIDKLCAALNCQPENLLNYITEKLNKRDKFYSSVKITPRTDPQDLPSILTAKEVGAFLGLHKNGTYELMKRKDFPSIFLGKKIIVPRDAFLEWLKNEAAKAG